MNCGLNKLKEFRERNICNILKITSSTQKKLSLLTVLRCNYYVNIYFKCHSFESLTLADWVFDTFVKTNFLPEQLNQSSIYTLRNVIVYLSSYTNWPLLFSTYKQ